MSLPRFVSWNVPNLHLVEDPYFARAAEFEQADAVEAIRQSGGGVARIYALSVHRKGDDPNWPRHIHIHILGPTTPALNEQLMRDLDRAVALASKAGIKLIVPFIDHWPWWGSAGDFARLVSSDAKDPDFYTDRSVISAFKDIISILLLRNNTVSGIEYRADPTILAWETGNELAFSNTHPPASWTLEIARHIKSLGTLPSQLVIDGTHSKYGWPSEVLKSADVDGITGHYYPLSISDAVPVGNWVGVGICAAAAITLVFLLGFHQKVEAHIPKKRRELFLISSSVLLVGFLAGLGILAWHIYSLISAPIANQFLNDMKTLNSLNSSKLFYVGEFGMRPVSELEGMLRAVLAEPRCVGALMWSLRFRSSQGGFFTHREAGGYMSYHHPGIPGNPSAGFPEDSVEVHSLVRRYAARIRGVQAELGLPVPGAPEMISVVKGATGNELRWRGSTGATSYEIQRGAEGNWTTVASQVFENWAWGQPGYVDTANIGGATYRIRAVNDAGQSSWSGSGGLG